MGHPKPWRGSKLFLIWLSLVTMKVCLPTLLCLENLLVKSASLTSQLSHLLPVLPLGMMEALWPCLPGISFPPAAMYPVSSEWVAMDSYKNDDCCQCLLTHGITFPMASPCIGDRTLSSPGMILASNGNFQDHHDYNELHPPSFLQVTCCTFFCTVICF